MSTLSVIGLVLITFSVYYGARTYESFVRNLSAAKGSNIPYIVVPIYWLNPLWRITQPLCMPVLRRLPLRWTDPWLSVIEENWTWTSRYAIFERLGTDTFLTVSPGGNTLYLANASVINEITSRRTDFPKPIQDYKLLEIYGRSLVSSEGQVWKQHRKIAGALFTEKSNHTVWAESIQQTQAILKYWIEDSGLKSSTIYTVEEDTMRLSLHVISRVGFGVHLPMTPAKHENGINSEGSYNPIDQSSRVGQPESGHKMTYADAINIVLCDIMWILVIPRFLLKFLPFEKTQKMYRAYVEWGKYMEEMFETSKAKLASENASEETDFMIGLIKGAGAGAGAVPEGPNASPISDKDPHIQKQMLTDSEILGNVFLLILAGHETTANSLHFSLVYLALDINSQRHLQSDLDRIFQGRQICEWDYSRDVPRLFNSMAEAVLNEQLRLIPPVTVIPKCAPKTQPDQAITINNKKCVVPAGTYIMILSVAAHRNPQFWPAGPPSDPKHPAHPLSNTDNDLEEFKPERWLQDPQPGCFTVTSPPSDPNLIGKSEPTSLFRPPKGAFIPFSEGPRSCIGRRFAQVEVLAVLAVIFSQYSVELAVDGFASDEEIEAMSTKERKEIWMKAKKVTESALKDKMGSILSLKLRGAKVPLRFVKRGTERFS